MELNSSNDHIKNNDKLFEYKSNMLILSIIPFFQVYIKKIKELIIYNLKK